MDMRDDQDRPNGPGPKIIQSAVLQAIDLLTNKLLTRAKENEGGLSVPEIQEAVEEFSRAPDSLLTGVFEDAWKKCFSAAETTHWKTARKFHFERVMVKTFSELLPANDEIVQSGRHLSRRIIPGFIHVLQQMLGHDAYEKYGDRTKALVETLRAVHGEGFSWAEVYADDICRTVVEEVLIAIVPHFSDMAKRRNWMIDVVEGQMPGTSNEAEKNWRFDDGAFHSLINTVYADLRETLQTPEGREELEVRYGLGNIAALSDMFVALSEDHADLMRAKRI